MDDGGKSTKWADKFKKKKPELTEEQIEANNKKALANMDVIQGEFVPLNPNPRPQGPAPTPPNSSQEQSPPRPQGSAPTPPEKFEPIYDDIDKIREGAKARWEAEQKAKGKATEYTGMPTEKVLEQLAAVSEYGNAADILKSGRELQSPTSAQEYGTIPDLTPKDLQGVLYETTKGNPRMASYLEDQIDKISKGMEAITIKTEKGIKIDTFQPSNAIINEELQNPDKAKKFSAAIESAVKESDLSKQDKIIKDAIKDVVQGHKTDLIKQMEKANEGLTSNVLKDAKYSSPKDLPETAKARPTSKGTGFSR